MAFHRRPSKNDRSSIKYWWIPVPQDAQSFQPENAFSNGNVPPHSKSHGKSSKQSETKKSSNMVSTSQFVSAVAGIWEYVGQPAVFQAKSSLNYGEIFSKENKICHSDSLLCRPVSSVSGKNISNDPLSRSCSSSSAKSNFEELKTMKKMLCFASCNRSINNLTFLSDSHPNAGSSRLDEVTNNGVSNDIAYDYGRLITKPYFGLGEHAKLSRNACHEKDVIGKKCPTANQSSTYSTVKNSMREDENSFGDKKVNIVDSLWHSPDSLLTIDSVQSPPVTSRQETVIVSSNLYSGDHSDYNEGVITSAEWKPKQLQPSTDSSCMSFESSPEVSRCKDHIIHEKFASVFPEVLVDDEYMTRYWLSVQDKLQLAFDKNKHALAGALAGTLVSLCLHPVDTVKTVIQANGAAQKSSSDIIRTIISDRGVSGLYRGIASNIASAAPISAIYTYTYESVKSALLPILPKEYYSFAHCIAGGCSSVATSFIFTPSERIKQQMQVGSQYQNCWNAVIGCLEKGGIPSLYAGWGAVLCRNIPHSVIKFYTYERLKQLFLTSSKPNATLSTLQTLVCGGLAGSTAALFTTPFDVVKTRLQTQVPGSLAKYDGVVHALQEIAREEGLQGLYRGLTPRLAMYVSQGAIFFASYEFLKTVLSLETPPRVVDNEDDENVDFAPSRLQKLNS